MTKLTSWILYCGLMIKLILIATVFVVTSIASTQAHCGSCEHKKDDKCEKKDDKKSDSEDKDAKKSEEKK